MPYTYRESQPIHPAWVMFGVELPDRVCLYASRTLTQAELELKVEDNWYIFSDWWSFPPRNEYELHATFDDFVVITGDTWADCFNDLQNHWSPSSPKPARQIPARHALESRVRDDTV
jgi:hypothetical protein